MAVTDTNANFISIQQCCLARNGVIVYIAIIECCHAVSTRNLAPDNRATRTEQKCTKRQTPTATLREFAPSFLSDRKCAYAISIRIYNASRKIQAVMMAKQAILVVNGALTIHIGESTAQGKGRVIYHCEMGRSEITLRSSDVDGQTTVCYAFPDTTLNNGEIPVASLCERSAI
jgi:hypothetical protein